jgi:hypothetical protein
MDMAVSPLKRGREFSARIFGNVAGDMTINSRGGFVDTGGIDARPFMMSMTNKAICRLTTTNKAQYRAGPHLFDSSMLSVGSCEMPDI